MTDQAAGVEDPSPAGVPPGGIGPSTRGFLFADLRGYTDFAERHGDAAAGDLLGRYRVLMRSSIARFGGAEIRTEGDSFYVVFASVSAAVRCGLAIAVDARAATVEHPELPLQVGVGINAGEMVDTSEGYVGSPVNIAARICSQAAAGEVLVSETVRALTRTVLPVRFDSRGKRQLKGVSDPVALYAVTEMAAGAQTWDERRPRRLTRRHVVFAGIALVLAVVLAGVAWWVSRPAAGLPVGDWKIGLEMPLTGGAAHRGVPSRNAVQMAIDQANARGGLGAGRLVIDAHDDAGETPNGQDNELGAANATAMVADPSIIAMVGPWGSSVAAEIIPVTNRAGLLECSPSNTDPSLTKPRFGALDLRAAHPDRINYVRIAPADDIQAPALATFAYRDLNAARALVIDDTDFGREIADQFAQSFEKLGGKTVRLALNKGADPATLMSPLSDPKPAELVFFGGFADTGAPEVRHAMVAAGYGAVPFLSWDGILGSGADQGSYIQLAGPDAPGSYAAHASLAPATQAFDDAYVAAFHAEPDEYASAGFACTEIIVQAIRAVAGGGMDTAQLREAVRAHVVDSRNRFETALGPIGFDANGDALQQYVTLYRVDASAAAGKGDWVYFKQRDFGPAP